MTARSRYPRAGRFRCEICDETYEQRSRYERHLQTSHPRRAASAADLEQALAGIDFPKPKRGLVAHAAHRGSSPELLELIRTLPPRTYRDAAEVGVALGELKRRRPKRRAGAEPPSRKGGRAAARVPRSASGMAKILTGIRFPASKAELRKLAWRNRTAVVDSQVLLDALGRVPAKRYRSIAEVARAVSAAH